MTDELKIWAAFQQGSVEAYTQLYNSFITPLYDYGMKFTRDVAAVEDSIHDLFCTLWVSRQRLRQPASVRNYLFKSMRTTLFRKISRNVVFFSGEQDFQFSFELPVVDRLCQDEQMVEMQNDVHRAMERLTPRQREIIYYRFYQNLDFDEIADIMDMQVRATYKLTSRALGVLRQLVSPRTAGAFILFFFSR
jgi:RNA polymerase sigma factor (sigma-70 family)